MSTRKWLCAGTALVVALMAAACGGGGNGDGQGSGPAWSTQAPLPVALARASAVLHNGKIHSFGGEDAAVPNGSALQARVYDPAADAWTRLADYPGGKPFESGGRLYAASDSAIAEYDDARDRWSTFIADPAAARGATGEPAVAQGGKLWYFGGVDANGAAVSDIDVLDLLTKTWSKAGSVAGRQFGGPYCAVGDELIGFGANAVYTHTTATSFDLVTRTWTPRAGKPGVQLLTACAVVGDRLYLLGGVAPSDQLLDTVSIYSASADHWTQDATALPSVRAALSAVADGTRIYAIGGFASGAAPFFVPTDAVDALETSRLEFD